MKLLLRTGAATALTLLMAGCAATHQRASTQYLLHPLTPAEASASIDRPSLLIAKPSVASGLETDRVAAFLHQGRELDYFAGARWSGRLDDVVHEFLLESFDGRYAVVDTELPGASHAADYLLATKVRDFQAEFTSGPQGAPTLRVRVAATLVALPSGEVRARMVESASQQALDESLRTVTAGIEQLLQIVTARLMERIDRAARGRR